MCAVKPQASKTEFESYSMLAQVSLIEYTFVYSSATTILGNRTLYPWIFNIKNWIKKDDQGIQVDGPSALCVFVLLLRSSQTYLYLILSVALKGFRGDLFPPLARCCHGLTSVG